MEERSNLAELLQWYADVGVDEAIEDTAADRTQAPPVSVSEKVSVIPLSAPAKAALPPLAMAPASDAAPDAMVIGAVEAIKEAKERAAGAKTLEELKAAIESFAGLSLKRTATHIVFADGNPKARIMLVGEAPGADEDRAGRPFVGGTGQLLDKMLGAIQLNRDEHVYLTTVLNWRTPGNRAPTPSEIEMSLPFVQRHIALVNPAILVFVGGAAAKILLKTEQNITRMRGKWLEYTDDGKTIPALALLHPEYLIQNPAQKKVAWEDLQMLQAKLKEMSVV